MTLNLNIRALRKAKKLTIGQLAEIVGVSIPHMSEVERGKKNLNNHLMTRISAALGVPAEALISSEDSHDVSQLLAISSQLDQEDRDRVVAFASALLKSNAAPLQIEAPQPDPAAQASKKHS